MTPKKHKAELEGWIQPVMSTYNKSDDRSLGEALYAFREMGLLEEDLDIDTAVRVWAIVASVRKNFFPTVLWM